MTADDEDVWWMSYDLKCGEEIVLTEDVTHYLSDEGNPRPTKTYKKGTKGKVVVDDEGPHQSINGTLAYVVLDGEPAPVLFNGGDFIPTALVR
jgi:hypothetical protein